MSKITETQYSKDNNIKSEQREEIRIEDILEEDTDDVFKMLRTFFYKDEPINHYIELGVSAELDSYTQKALVDKCSFKAVNAHGEIIGVIVNAIAKKPNPNDPIHSYSAGCKDPKFKKILMLFDYIDEQFNTFKLYPDIATYLDVAILSVNANYRGYGVAGMLMEKTLKYMRENEIKVVRVLCTSFYSARVCEKTGFKKVYNLPYADYKVDGVTVFKPEKPHEAVQILTQEIN
ncbi:dopamine N-acetyltransferase-like [Contarinia nasturtii]|uniref:dopamine N-acetyltransferase-like n=1 Tax=Contarinia nasturtii TaxID=265458 RepID=UPI0012D46578|nr:dopamine N-acetyltransferase-like [Contarinia nasturtii]